MLVEQSIYEEVVQRLAKRFSAVRAGPPADDLDMGPLINKAGLDKVAAMVELHEMSMVDGAMAMQAMPDGLVVAAGRGKVLEPGGYHVMLMDLKQPLAKGAT